jgi:lysozyme family protein
MAFPTPREAIAYSINQYEGLWQDHPNDSGNYAHCQDGTTKLVGTMRGITPDALARFRGVDPCTITVDILKAVTPDIAADIAMQGYYHTSQFDTLTWSPLVDITFDASFMSGPARAIKMLQECIGSGIDGGIGPQTREALDIYLETTPIEDACNRMADIRNNFYISISQPGTKNAIYRQGWLNRSNAMRPGTPWWQGRWEGWKMPHPAGSSKATGVMPAV